MTDDADNLISDLRLNAEYQLLVIEDYRKAADRIEELEHLFDLRWAADMRAIRLWQSAHPDQPRTWPDHADLGTWCLSRIEMLEAALRMIAGNGNATGCNPQIMCDIASKALEGKDGQ